MNKSMQVLKNRATGLYAAIDEASGGYPYDVLTPDKAQDWSTHTTERIHNYIRNFPNYYLVKVNLQWTEEVV